MKVCIEYVIIDNLIMDYLLLKASSALLKIKFKKGRLILASLAGVICAVIFPLLSVKAEYLFLLKIMSGALVCFIAVNHRSVFGYFEYFNVFLLITFVTGGAVIGVFYLMGIRISEYSQAKSVLPVGVSVGVAYITAIVVKRVAEKTVNGLITDKFRYNCILKSGSAVVRTIGYFDSGNMLIDKATGLPVALCKRSVIQKIAKRGGKVTKPRKMEISTVSSVGTIDLYEIDCMLIERGEERKRADCLLGVSAESRQTEELIFGAYLM